MVYRLRNKNLFMTANGFKNNYYHNCLNMPKEIIPETSFSLQTRSDHHSFLRLVQSYRNFSRGFKQYMYGDRKLEEMFLIALRQAYTLPLWSETPTHLMKDEAERRFADSADRDYELIHHNYHPFQLNQYELNNK